MTHVGFSTFADVIPGFWEHGVPKMAGSARTLETNSLFIASESETSSPETWTLKDTSFISDWQIKNK